jgi:dTDP-4-dehydrorhamnose reductase
MKALITGMNGTVAPALAAVLREKGHTVTGWDRNAVPTDDPAAGELLIRREEPDWFFQIATGPPDWIEHTAHVCASMGIRFIFTGSVSVFDGSRSGPFAKDHPADAGDDYGRYKAECEERIRAVHPEAVIARLGWQIGNAPGSNNMIDFLAREQREKGGIIAGTGWIPSTAFLEDTADALYRLAADFPSGLYQLEGNVNGMNFYDLVTALNRLHGNLWTVTPHEEPRRDNRMLDDAISLPALEHRLS